MKDLLSLNKLELENFFDSFDHVMCDVDGVLWLHLETIPGTIDAVKSLRKLGKKVTFVSNNSTKPFDVYVEQLQTAGFDIEPKDLIVPQLAMVSYLKQQNFTKAVYLIGMEPVRIALKDAGFTVVDKGPDRIDETIADLAKHTLVDDENVGAVISDVDVNLTYIKMQKAVTYLRRPDVIFLKGAMDCKAPVGKNRILIGPGYFHKIIEDLAGREAHTLAKPGVKLKEYIVEKLKIKDSSRVLFVGDSISEDMGFAATCGYKKLLVLSGLTKRDSLENWTFPREYKPDYYADSLNIVHKVISQNL